MAHGFFQGGFPAWLLLCPSGQLAILKPLSFLFLYAVSGVHQWASATDSHSGGIF